MKKQLTWIFQCLIYLKQYTCANVHLEKNLIEKKNNKFNGNIRVYHFY